MLNGAQYFYILLCLSFGIWFKGVGKVTYRVNISGTEIDIERNELLIQATRDPSPVNLSNRTQLSLTGIAAVV